LKRRQFLDNQTGNKYRAIRAFVQRSRDSGVQAVFHRAYMEYVARWQLKMDVATSVAMNVVVPHVLEHCIGREHQRLLDIAKQKQLAKELKIRHFGTCCGGCVLCCVVFFDLIDMFRVDCVSFFEFENLIFYSGVLHLHFVFMSIYVL